MPSYFKRYYLIDVKLAQRALLEFHRSLKTGRMIAFTGALTTQSCGYGTWNELVQSYARIASVLKSNRDFDQSSLSEIINNNKFDFHDSIQKILDYRDKSKSSHSFDVRVALGLMEEVVIGNGQSRVDRMRARRPTVEFELDAVHEPLDELSIGLARYFRKPHRLAARDSVWSALSKLKSQPDLDRSLDVVRSLRDALGIKRFATLNYDFELERQAMLNDPAGEIKDSPFDELLKLRAKGAGEGISWNLESGRIRRILDDGQAVESDILNRERIDRMLEFAIGADDVDEHILHMHGRACDHRSMIVSYRDYDRLYRRNDLYKLPFEFAQRIMIGGNPVLFVGLGMSEQELNETLQDFVSSSPYQRLAPTFLFWNINKKREEMESSDWLEVEALRLDRLHRLGVLTIFDVDIPCPGDGQSDSIVKPPKGASELSAGTKAAMAIHNLRWLVDNVEHHAEKVAERGNYTRSTAWRHMDGKIAEARGKADDNTSPIILWEVLDGKSTFKGQEDPVVSVEAIMSSLTDAATSRLCIIGAQGSGNGLMSLSLAQAAAKAKFKGARTLLINGSFSFDTDSLLDGIARFFFHWRGGNYLGDRGDLPPVPTCSRHSYFTKLGESAGPVEPLLIVINGMERFFSVNGQLLSAELDELLSLAARNSIPNVSWVLFGSERVRAYALAKGFGIPASLRRSLPVGDECLEVPFERMAAISEAFNARSSDETKKVFPLKGLTPASVRLLKAEADRYRARSASQISGGGAGLRQAFYKLYLGVAFDERVGPAAPLAHEVLRALAFIGVPTELSVLTRVPRIVNRANLKSSRARAKKIASILKKLVKLRLVIEVRGYTQGDENKRYTLPRTLMTEVRHRFSVPLSEAKLSTAFNMSLYIAQPVDGYIPEPDIHDELGELVDRLIGAYRDDATEEAPPADWANALELVAKEVATHERTPVHGIVLRGSRAVSLAAELNILGGVAHSQRLRAALALMRGYYTTTDLLTLDVGDRLIREDRDGVLLEHAERIDALIDAYGKVARTRDTLREQRPDAFLVQYGGAEPLYPDELVWLHNERGVVHLAMGDVIQAAESFDHALDINRRHVEGDDRAHNWRRVRLNQLITDIESGSFSLAQRKIEEIIGDIPKHDNVDNIDLREDRLALAIVRGHRGRIHQLTGNAELALQDYDAAIAMLMALDEPRARAYFLCFRSERGGPGAREDIAAALDIANATRQMDIVYHLRIRTALADLVETPSGGADRARSQRVLDEAMRYALQTDMHRIRVEAGAAMAESRLFTGDYEGALRSVSDALMVATRFGMELHKIVLRSVLARIMAKRGHPVTASKLAMTTIKIASRRKYESAIDHAEATLLGIPKVSAITDVIDAAARRQL